MIPVYGAAQWDTHVHYVHTQTTVTLMVRADLSCSIDSNRSFSLVRGERGGASYLFDAVCTLVFIHVRACCSRRRAPLEKVVRPLCLWNSFRIHDPDSCLFFLSGEGTKDGGMEGAMVNERGSDRYRRGWNEEAKKKGGGRQSDRGLFPFPSLWPQSSLACWAFEAHHTINGVLNSFH